MEALYITLNEDNINLKSVVENYICTHIYNTILKKIKTKD